MRVIVFTISSAFAALRRDIRAKTGTSSVFACGGRGSSCCAACSTNYRNICSFTDFNIYGFNVTAAATAAATVAAVICTATTAANSKHLKTLIYSPWSFPRCALGDSFYDEVFYITPTNFVYDGQDFSEPCFCTIRGILCCTRRTLCRCRCIAYLGELALQVGIGIRVLDEGHAGLCVQDYLYDDIGSEEVDVAYVVAVCVCKCEGAAGLRAVSSGIVDSQAFDNRAVRGRFECDRLTVEYGHCLVYSYICHVFLLPLLFKACLSHAEVLSHVAGVDDGAKTAGPVVELQTIRCYHKGGFISCRVIIKAYSQCARA